MVQVAVVMWSGQIGGAETVSGYLATELRRQGLDARVVFVEDGDALGAALTERAVPWTALELPRGRAVFQRPRRYARSVGAHGRECAIVMTGRSLALALRLGGYKGRILAVEHGDMFLDGDRPAVIRKLRSLDRALSARAIDVEIGVSRFTVEQMRLRPHAADVRCIPNGIPVHRFRPISPLGAGSALRVGWAGRLVRGKGVERLLEVLHLLRDTRHPVHLQIAGDGPMRGELWALSERLELSERLSFIGWAEDMANFWNSCDVAVASSDGSTETFGMAPLEAAACGRPAVVTRNGGLGEVVVDSETGSVVPARDAPAMADAIAGYADDERLLRAHGQAARERAVEKFSIERCASAYVAAMS
jgi:glycosyltransferase involved in cell wall biosynthesis